MSHTIREVQQAFLNRQPLKTTHLESTEDGRLVSYGWYEIARWVTTCRFHAVNVDTYHDDAAHESICPLARTRIIRRNNGMYPGSKTHQNGWYSVSTSKHVSGIWGADVEVSPIPTPRGDSEMRF